MIEVDHLGKVYGSTQAIEDVTFAVEAGEILGFLGPNGAGKTTTMRILTGYLPASSGTATIAGFEVHADSMAVRQRIGYLPENPPLYPDMSVEGYLDFVAQIKGVSAGDRPQRITTAIDRCGLSDRRKTLIRKLSKGYKQRVGIAQAIVHDPPVIILDEPTVGLDPRQIIEVRNLIKNLAGDHTVILSTHILPEVSMTCSRVAIINNGRIVTTNSPDHLITQLTSGVGYELEVEGEADSFFPLLQKIPGVSAVEQLKTDSVEPRLQIRVLAEQGMDIGRTVAATVVGAGAGLYEMRRIRASLEDVFLQLTTQELTDTTETAEPPEATAPEPVTDLPTNSPQPSDPGVDS